MPELTQVGGKSPSETISQKREAAYEMLYQIAQKNRKAKSFAQIRAGRRFSLTLVELFWR